MKKLLIVLLATAAGCVYPEYTVRKPINTDPPLSREEIERLSTAGVSESVMIEMLDKRGANALTTDDVVALKNAGTPDPVVQKALSSEKKVVERVIVDNYYYAYPYPYYYPYYGASFYFGYPYHYHGYYGGYYGGYRGAAGVRVYRK